MLTHLYGCTRACDLRATGLFRLSDFDRGFGSPSSVGRVDMVEEVKDGLLVVRAGTRSVGPGRVIAVEVTLHTLRLIVCVGRDATTVFIINQTVAVIVDAVRAEGHYVVGVFSSTVCGCAVWVFAINELVLVVVDAVVALIGVVVATEPVRVHDNDLLPQPTGHEPCEGHHGGSEIVRSLTIAVEEHNHREGGIAHGVVDWPLTRVIGALTIGVVGKIDQLVVVVVDAVVAQGLAETVVLAVVRAVGAAPVVPDY